MGDAPIFPLKKKTPITLQLQLCKTFQIIPPAAERGNLANFPCIQGDGTNDGLSSGQMVRFGDWNFGSKLDGLVGDMVEVELR